MASRDSLGISACPESTESTVHSPQFFARGSDVLNVGSFAIPRAFHKWTRFDQRPISTDLKVETRRTDLTDFEARDHPAPGSFAIPRDFHKQTSFRSRPISTEQDQFETEGPIWGHVITARLLALNHASFGTRREVSARSKKSENLWKYTFMYLTCRESSGLIFITKNANFLEFSYREQQRMQSKKINWAPNRSDSQIIEDIHTYWKNRIKIYACSDFLNGKLQMWQIFGRRGWDGAGSNLHQIPQFLLYSRGNIKLI